MAKPQPFSCLRSRLERLAGRVSRGTGPAPWVGAAVLLAALHVVDLAAGTVAWGLWLELVLAAGVFLLARDFVVGGLRRLSRGRAVVGARDALPCLAAAGAFGYSFVALLVHSFGLLDPSFAVTSASVRVPRVYLGAGATIVVAFLLAERILGRIESGLRARLELAGMDPDELDGEAGSDLPGRGNRRDPHSLDRGTALGILAAGLTAAVMLPWARGGIDAPVLGLVIAVLVLASPGRIAVLARIARAVWCLRSAGRGYRFGAAGVLDRLAAVDYVVFRKFKTLTTGCPQVTDVVPVQAGVTSEEILYLSAALIYKTDHPIRDAILLRSSEICRTIPHIKDFQFTPGRGVRAVFQGQEVFLGNERYIADRGIPCDDARERIDGFAAEKKTVLLLASEGRVTAILAIADDLRGECREAISRLRELGVRTALFSGDHAGSVGVLSRDLGLDDVEAELTRAETQGALEEIKQRGHRVAMVATDIEPSILRRLDAGIVFGAERGEEMRPNEVRLGGDDLRDVPELLLEARRSRRRRAVEGIAFAAVHAAVLLVLVLPFFSVFGVRGSVLTGASAGSWLSLTGLLAALAPAASAWLASRGIALSAPGRDGDADAAAARNPESRVPASVL